MRKLFLKISSLVHNKGNLWLYLGNEHRKTVTFNYHRSWTTFLSSVVFTRILKTWAFLNKKSSEKKHVMCTGGKMTWESQVKSIDTNYLSDGSTPGARNLLRPWKCGFIWELQIYHHLNRHYDTLTADQGLYDYSNHCCLFSDEAIGTSTSSPNNVSVLTKHRLDHGNAMLVKEKK